MKRWRLTLIVLAIVLIAAFLIKNRQGSGTPQTTLATPIRIGWQVPWAIQGQLTQILKHTQVLQDTGLTAEFKGFTFGGPLNEAALAGAVDVIFTADQPAATLLTKDPNWVIIGRLMYNRVSLYVPPQSPIQTVAHLKGKTVGMPFGAAAQRMALLSQKDAGLDPQVDVNNVNLDIYEQSDLVRDPKAVKWGTMDALAGFDPTPAILEDKGLVRNLAVGKVVSLIVMDKDYIASNPQAPEQFLTAFYQAYVYYRHNLEQVNQWFVEEAKLDITPNSLMISSSLEPNLTTDIDSQIRLGFTADDLTIMQQAADFIYQQKLVLKQIKMSDYVDQTYLERISLK